MYALSSLSYEQARILRRLPLEDRQKLFPVTDPESLDGLGFNCFSQGRVVLLEGFTNEVGAPGLEKSVIVDPYYDYNAARSFNSIFVDDSFNRLNYENIRNTFPSLKKVHYTRVKVLKREERLCFRAKGSEIKFSSVPEIQNALKIRATILAISVNYTFTPEGIKVNITCESLPEDRTHLNQSLYFVKVCESNSEKEEFFDKLEKWKSSMEADTECRWYKNMTREIRYYE